MGNLMTSMYTGVSGLMVNQTSINTAAHNIANVDSKGYTRQQILTSDFLYTKLGNSAHSGMQVGLGTKMSIIRQVRNIFLDKSYRLEIGKEGFYSSQGETVEEIESLFGEIDGEPYGDTLSDMWTAISELAKESDNIVKRGVTVSTASNFLRKAEIIKNQLADYQVNLNTQIQKKVDRINEIGDSINHLNETIRKYEGRGQQANDYRDVRNQLLDELGGLVNISYKEDKYGSVNVSVEGVQFVTDNVVYHMETKKTVTVEEKARADSINAYFHKISDQIQNMKSTGASDADIEEAVKSSNEWNELSRYGKLKYETNGDITYNGYGAIHADGKIEEVLPKQSDLLTVLWKGNGYGEVFRLDGDYSSAANTNVGSLKGLLVARGTYAANYTNMPVESDYANEKDYKAAIDEYNKYVDASVVMSTQAQFDQLIHEIVTKINDIMCPNMEITSDTISNLLSKTTGSGVLSTQVDVAGAKITLPDGTVVKADSVRIFDAVSAGCGMDDDKTQGEALFERKNRERYTKGTLSVEVDGVQKDIEVLVYNEEYASDAYTLFTIGEIEINENILKDPNKLPLNYNQYSGKDGAVSKEICEALIDAWDKEDLKINPNTETRNNFQDYYNAFTVNIGYRGKTYNDIAEKQRIAVDSIDVSRQQVAGVSSEDELTNLIKYQHAYNASSRYINAINDMLGHILERLG